MNQRRFTHEQAKEILRRADQKTVEDDQETLSERELEETAKELGIDPARLQQAIAALEKEDDLTAALREVKSERRSRLRSHVSAFFIMMSSLAFIDWQTNGALDWVQWPFFFWTLWLVVHVVTFVTPDTDRLLKKAERRVRSKRWRQRGRKLGATIEKSVGELIDRATEDK